MSKASRGHHIFKHAFSNDDAADDAQSPHRRANCHVQSYFWLWTFFRPLACINGPLGLAAARAEPSGSTSLPFILRPPSSPSGLLSSQQQQQQLLLRLLMVMLCAALLQLCCVLGLRPCCCKKGSQLRKNLSRCPAQLQIQLILLLKCFFSQTNPNCKSALLLSSARESVSL